MFGGGFPEINDCICMSKTKQAYLNDCVLMYNLIKSRKNICFLDDNEQYTIYYADKNSDTYIFDQNTGIMKKSEMVATDDVFFTMSDELNNSFLDIDKNIKIPLYYLSLNNNDIFNIYISNADTNDDLFRIFDGKFLSMSVTFNIFNLSLTTHTFFDVLKIFINVFDIFKNPISKDKLQNSRHIKKLIRTKLNDIYLPKKQIIEKLNHLFTFKKKVITLNNIEAEQQLNKTDCDFGKDAKYETIIQSLVEKIFNLCEYLESLSNNISCDMYKYMFLLSILSYKLKNKLINGSWPFSIKYVLKNMGDYIINEKSNASSFFQKKNTLYEYSMTNYKGITFPNCMENTILQFLKVLFWNNVSKTYDFNMIKNIIDKKYLNDDNFIYFFNNIHDERTQSYIDKWTDFLMSKGLQYQYVKTGHELNTTFKNLMLFLRELFVKSDIVNDIEFLNSLLKLYGITLSIEYDYEEITISITLSYDKLDVIFVEGKHSMFKNIDVINICDQLITYKKTQLNADNILEKLLDIRKENVYDNNLFVCDSQIFQYVLLFAIYSRPINNTLAIFYQFIEKYAPYLIENTFESIFGIGADRNLKMLQYTTYSSVLKNNNLINRYYYLKYTMFFGSYDDDVRSNIFMKSPAYNDTLFDIMLIYQNVETHTLMKILLNDGSFDNQKFKYFTNNAKTINFFTSNAIRPILMKDFGLRSKFFDKLIANLKNFETWDDNEGNDNPPWYYILMYFSDNANFYNELYNHTFLFKKWHIMNCEQNTKCLWEIFVVNILHVDWEKIFIYDLFKHWNYNVWKKLIDRYNSKLNWALVFDYDDVMSVIGKMVVDIIQKNRDDNKILNKIIDEPKYLMEIDWEIFFNYNRPNDEAFLNKLSTLSNITNKWNEVIWIMLMEHYKEYDIFWNNISKNTKNFSNWNNKIGDKSRFICSLSEHAIRFIKNDIFWENIAMNKTTNRLIIGNWKSDLYNNYIPWINAIMNIESKIFWEKISENPKYFREWFINYNGHTHWNYAFESIMSPKFWMNISLYPDIFKNWDAPNIDSGDMIYENAMKHVNILKFWENVYGYDISQNFKEKIKSKIKQLKKKSQRGGHYYEKYLKYVKKSLALNK